MALVEDIATLFDKTDSMVTEMKALAAGKKMRFAMHLSCATIEAGWQIDCRYGMGNVQGQASDGR